MDKHLAKRFGIVLKQLRAKAEVSQEDLAHRCKLDRTYISMLERGVRQPTISTLFTLASELKIAPSEFISKVERVTK